MVRAWIQVNAPWYIPAEPPGSESKGVNLEYLRSGLRLVRCGVGSLLNNWKGWRISWGFDGDGTPAFTAEHWMEFTQAGHHIRAISLHSTLISQVRDNLWVRITMILPHARLPFEDDHWKYICP